MTSLKLWSVLPLSVLLLPFITLTVTEVVKSVSQCDEFVFKKPPEVPGILENGQIMNPGRYKSICQTYEDKKRFVTLYDTINKIAVFSAYKYRGEGEQKPKNIPWKIEPQLEDLKKDKNMEDYDSRVKYKNQATYKDYSDVTETYSRGHLFPVSYAFNKSDKMSTYTLTNIIPQVVSFNRGSWEKMEKCVSCILKKYCLNKEGYVVTGATPGKAKLNNKVNIPSVLWSAFCCHSEDKKKFLASAHWGDNTAEDSTSKYLQMKTLAELKEKLRVEVFPGGVCPPNKNVAEFYPEIKKTCKCQSQALTTSAPPTDEQLFLEFLYGSQKFHTICKNVLRKSVTFKGHQSKNLWGLCLKLQNYQLRPGDIDVPLKKLLLELLSKSRSYNF